MYLKCHVSWLQEMYLKMSCVLATGNVPEMSCVLATGNLPEILPYTVPGNVKEISKFPGVGNVHTMNRNCELSCTFHGISWSRKFRISSSVTCVIYCVPYNIDWHYCYRRLTIPFNKPRSPSVVTNSLQISRFILQ